MHDRDSCKYLEWFLSKGQLDLIFVASVAVMAQGPKMHGSFATYSKVPLDQIIRLKVAGGEGTHMCRMAIMCMHKFLLLYNQPEI